MHPWQHLMLVTVLQLGRVQNSAHSYFGSSLPLSKCGSCPHSLWFCPLAAYYETELELTGALEHIEETLILYSLYSSPRMLFS